MRVFISLVAFNASTFIALYLLRRPRPKMRIRLVRWVLNSESARESRVRNRSVHPA
jgi:hypothetical protein